MLSGCAAYIGSRAYYAVDLIGDSYFFIRWVVGVFCYCSGSLRSKEEYYNIIKRIAERGNNSNITDKWEFKKTP